MSKQREAGFTILELMIATVVFSVVVLLITGAIIQIGRSYTKGMTSSRTQEAARRVIDDISQAIIYSPNDPLQNDANKTLCIGDRQYSYARGRQVSSTNWGLIATSSVPGCSAVTGTRPTGYSELLDNTMRLSNFSVTRVGDSDSYTVTVRVVSGDADLLCTDPTPSGLPDCNSTTEMTDSQVLGQNNLRCKNSRAGNEFCAMSQLTTTVTKRVRSGS